MTPAWYTTAEFAILWGWSKKSVYRGIYSGYLKAVKVGADYRIPRSEYCRFCNGLEKCEGCQKRK